MKAILAAILLTGSVAAQEPHNFNDKTNLALFSADALVRTLDWQSTRMNLSHGFVESSLPNSIAGSTPKMLGYSLGVAVGVHGLAYIAHRKGFHRIERILPMIDIAYDGRDVEHNYAISGKQFAGRK